LDKLEQTEIQEMPDQTELMDEMVLKVKLVLQEIVEELGQSGSLEVLDHVEIEEEQEHKVPQEVRDPQVQQEHQERMDQLDQLDPKELKDEQEMQALSVHPEVLDQLE